MLRSFAVTLAAALLAIPTAVNTMALPHYAVTVESGVLPAGDGTTVDYVVYTPRRHRSLASPPWPAVVLTHGFARDLGRMSLSAMALASRGVIVLTPTMPSLLGLQPARDLAIDLTRSHVEWLVRRSRTRGDTLYGLIDRARLGLAGHSAGGAISLEAAWSMQTTATPISALALLDAVPWTRTIERARSLNTVSVMSLRAPGSSCNAGASGAKLVPAFPFAVHDVFVVGASHCDPEAPTDIVCTLVCGASTVQARGAFQDVTAAFFRSAFRLPPAGPDSEGLDEALARLESAGVVQVLARP